MNFNPQQQYGAPQPQPQQYSGYGAPASPTWQATAPTMQQPPQKQAAMMGGNAPRPNPAAGANPFDNGFAGAPPAPTSPASYQQQMPQDGRAPEFDPSSPGTPGQRMPTSPVQQQPQQQPSADPFGSINYGASPASVAGGGAAAQPPAAAAPAPLMQLDQVPPAMGLRQPSLGMNANQQQPAPTMPTPTLSRSRSSSSKPILSSSSLLLLHQPPLTRIHSPSTQQQPAAAAPTSPAPAPTSPVPQVNNADPFASFGAAVAPAPAPTSSCPRSYLTCSCSRRRSLGCQRVWPTPRPHCRCSGSSCSSSGSRCTGSCSSPTGSSRRGTPRPSCRPRPARDA